MYCQSVGFLSSPKPPRKDSTRQTQGGRDVGALASCNMGVGFLQYTGGAHDMFATGRIGNG